MKTKFLRISVLVGSLLFILSSIGINAQTSISNIGLYGETPANTYIDVQKYGDDKVINNKEVNANIIDSEQIKKLIKLGFTKEEISTFSVSEYERYKNLNGTIVTKTEKYFRVKKGTTEEITKNQAIKEVREHKAKKAPENTSSLSSLNRFSKSLSFVKGILNKTTSKYMLLSNGSDTDSTSWLSMTTTASDLGGKSFLFKNSFTWLSAPICTFTDVLGMSHTSPISINQDSEYLKYTYDRYTNTMIPTYLGTNDVYYWTADKKNSGGYAFKYDLLGTTTGGDLVMYNRGYMVYSGIATPSNYIGYANVYGHYSHQQLALPIGIDLASGNMSCTPTYAFAETTDTDAQFYIN